jgi:hypothetical protein
MQGHELHISAGICFVDDISCLIFHENRQGLFVDFR